MATSKEKKTLNIVFGFLAIAILIAATYITLSHHPLANRISLWQAGLMNKKDQYFPALTIFILALPPLLLLLPLKIILLKFTQNKAGK